MKHYSPTGRRNHGRPSKRLLDTWDWNGSISGLTPWKIYDDDDDDDHLQLLTCPCLLGIKFDGLLWVNFRNWITVNESIIKKAVHSCHEFICYHWQVSRSASLSIMFIVIWDCLGLWLVLSCSQSMGLEPISAGGLIQGMLKWVYCTKPGTWSSDMLSDYQLLQVRRLHHWGIFSRWHMCSLRPLSGRGQ